MSPAHVGGIDIQELPAQPASMAAGWPSLGLAIVLLAGAESGLAGQAQPAASAPGQAATGETKRLGRKYPAPVAVQRSRSRAEPRVYVSVVSPRESGVFQRIEQQRTHSSGRATSPGTELPAEQMPFRAVP
jgi:hypothetical protein